jgi:signal transduction histidine kinase
MHKHRASPADKDLIEDGIGVTKRILALINNLLEVSKIEAGELQLQAEEVRPTELLREAVEPFRVVAQSRSIEMLTRVAPGTPDIRADRRCLGQVLDNLLGNAIKFTPEGGHIQVAVEVGHLSREDESERFGRSESPGDSGEHPLTPGVRMRVRDSGIGIAKEKQARIFEPFFQVDSSSTREYGGTGLGLTLVKNLVEAQGGRVWVESELGRGSIFTVTFPAHPAHPID